jgi:FkbM family methyltransferase
MQIIYNFIMRLRPAYLASKIKALLSLKRQVIITEYGKFFIDPVSNFGHSLRRDGVYEEDLSQYFQQILETGDTVVDVGANEGYYSILASKIVGTTGKILAIEPQSRLQNILFRNIELNEAYNVVVHQTTISDSLGSVKLNLTPDTNTGSSGILQSTKYRNPTETVPTKRLSDIVKLFNLNTINLLKMDIEGLEYQAVLGDRELFKSNIIKNFALELHPTVIKNDGKDSNKVINFLSECGFVPIATDDSDIRNIDRTILFKKTTSY